MEAYLSRPKYNDAFVEIIPTKIFVDAQITKQVILDEISEISRQAASNNVVFLEIYYTGHGCINTADWCGTITGQQEPHEY